MKKLFPILFSIILTISCSEQKPKILSIASEHLPAKDSVIVFTPEKYDSAKSYPLVILLHGWSGNYLQWNNISNLQEYSDAYNFIISCPDGFYDSWYLNNPLKPELQFEDFFWNDYIPYLTKSYSIEKNSIFISGLSMGGHGALNLYLKNPNFFNAAGSSSGILDLTFFPDRWSIKNGIGSINDYPDEWTKNSAFHIIDSTKHKGVKMIIDCGTEDFAYNVNLNFVKKCYDLGIEPLFISIPGNHNKQHWRKMIATHFEYFYKQVKKN